MYLPKMLSKNTSMVKLINAEKAAVATNVVHSPIPFAAAVAKEMLYNRQARLKLRQNINLVKQYTNELFPYNGDQRLVFLFLGFELHSEFPELASLLRTIVEALQLVQQVHSQKHTNLNPTSNLSKYLEHGSTQVAEQNLSRGNTMLECKVCRKHHQKEISALFTCSEALCVYNQWW